jgi:predicted N-acetyltransferase YhbS
MNKSNEGLSGKLEIRFLRETEIEEAERIVRLAFGTFLNFPDPEANASDRRMILHRFRNDPRKVIAAILNDELVGTNVLTEWGSFGFFGPLTVRPDLWNSKIGTILVAAAIDEFGKDNVPNLGLFTFPDSPKHMGLYHKFGFCSRFLTPIMGNQPPFQAIGKEINHAKFSELSSLKKGRALADARFLASELSWGVDLTTEIELVEKYRMGDTLLYYDETEKLLSFAICQSGAKTEAGLSNCYVKFAATKVNGDSQKHFVDLLTLVEDYAVERNVNNIEAGINLSHDAAFDVMLNRNFRVMFIGVAMQKPNMPMHERKDTFVIDDWR